MGKDKIFIERLELLRGSRTKPAFAKLVGLSPGKIRSYTEGDSEPRLGDLRLIANACNTTVGWLAGEKTNRPHPLTATGSGIVQVGGSVNDSNLGISNTSSGNYLLTAAEATFIEKDRQYGSPATRAAYIKQLDKLREIIEG